MLSLQAGATPQDRSDIEHLLAVYAWALDTADLTTLQTLFTPEALLQDTQGNRYQGREAIIAYFGELTSRPDFKGRQHHIDKLLLERQGDDCRCRAYWMVSRWDAATGHRQIDFTGHSDDIYTLAEGVWRIQERRLFYWRSDNCPWQGSGALPG